MRPARLIGLHLGPDLLAQDINRNHFPVHGSIASIMLLVGRAEGVAEWAIVLGAMTLVILVTLLALLASAPLMQLIGVKLEAMITRILGVILAALAAQFVIDGLKQSFPILG